MDALLLTDTGECNACTVDIESMLTEQSTCIHMTSCSCIHGTFMVPPVRLSTVGSRTFAVEAPHIWNRLPTDVVAANSLSTFCRLLKRFFISAIISWYILLIVTSPNQWSLQWLCHLGHFKNWLIDWLNIFACFAFCVTVQWRRQLWQTIVGVLVLHVIMVVTSRAMIVLILVSAVIYSDRALWIPDYLGLLAYFLQIFFRNGSCKMIMNYLGLWQTCPRLQFTQNCRPNTKTNLSDIFYCWLYCSLRRLHTDYLTEDFHRPIRRYMYFKLVLS